MKRLIIAAVAFSATTLTFAQTETKAPETSAPVETPAAVKAETAAPAPIEAAPVAVADEAATKDEVRTQVKIADLPLAVQRELGTVQYENWSPSVAYWVTGVKVEHYEITLVKGDESKAVKYNAEGTKLD